MQKDNYNIILFHLESINQIAFIKNKQCFPNLERLMNDSIRFENYYSTATSTYMVMGDVTYADVSCYEKSVELENIFHIVNDSQSVWDQFRQMGYNTGIFINGYSEEDPTEKVAEFLLPESNYKACDDTDKFIYEFECLITSKNKFAAYILENVSHIAYEGERIRGGLNVQERYIERYRVIDKVVGTIMEALEKSGHMDDTVIIMYGDHGDSMWGHGLHCGYLHAIPPYNEMIHCPFICKIPGQTPGSEKKLICTKDIRNLLLNYANGDFAFHIDEKKYVFSRNLYVNQPLNKNIFEKGYGVNNSDYTLIVTRRGLEMYMNNIDFSNQMNILEFFKLKKGKLVFNNLYYYVRSGHFKALMNSMTLNEIAQNFEFLHRQLKNEVTQIYQISSRSSKEMRLNQIYYSQISHSEKMKLVHNAFTNWAVRLYSKVKR